ncbi:hypothetical protein [Sinosporangium album]|nr:hypothetical protein [Sinosporangium album]
MTAPSPYSPRFPDESERLRGRLNGPWHQALAVMVLLSLHSTVAICT